MDGLFILFSMVPISFAALIGILIAIYGPEMRQARGVAAFFGSIVGAPSGTMALGLIPVALSPGFTVDEMVFVAGFICLFSSVIWIPVAILIAVVAKPSKSEENAP
jgi:hypothetical protein